MCLNFVTTQQRYGKTFTYIIYMRKFLETLEILLMNFYRKSGISSNITHVMGISIYQMCNYLIIKLV